MKTKGGAKRVRAGEPQTKGSCCPGRSGKQGRGVCGHGNCLCTAPAAEAALGAFPRPRSADQGLLKAEAQTVAAPRLLRGSYGPSSPELSLGSGSDTSPCVPPRWGIKQCWHEPVCDVQHLHSSRAR